MPEAKIEIISQHRMFCRNYTPKELLGEIKNLMNDENFADFMFIAIGKDGMRCVRIGSVDRDLRVGDLLYMNELIKGDIFQCP